MTAALLDRPTASFSGRPCPVWCANEPTSRRLERDLCDAGGGDRNHMGRIGGVVLPSHEHEFYDQEIGVELYRYDNADGTVNQLAVLLTYAAERGELGHVALSVADARRLVAHARSEGRKGGPVRFSRRTENNILMERPRPLTTMQVVMNVEGQSFRMGLHQSQMLSLGDLVACACVLAEVNQ